MTPRLRRHVSHRCVFCQSFIRAGLVSMADYLFRLPGVSYTLGTARITLSQPLLDWMPSSFCEIVGYSQGRHSGRRHSVHAAELIVSLAVLIRPRLARGLSTTTSFHTPSLRSLSPISTPSMFLITRPRSVFTWSRAAFNDAAHDVRRHPFTHLLVRCGHCIICGSVSSYMSPEYLVRHLFVSARPRKPRSLSCPVLTFSFRHC